MKLHELFEEQDEEEEDEESFPNLTTYKVNGKSVNTHVWDNSLLVSSKNLESLEGCPSEIHGHFSCADNNLESLKYGPKIVNQNCEVNNNNLKSLKYAPEHVGKYFNCRNNKIKNLKNIHKTMKYIGSRFYATKNPIESNVLGLLLIKGLIDVNLDNIRVMEILNKWLKEPFGNGRVLGAQSELIEANLDKYAQL